MIHGVQLTPLRIIADDRGAVLHMLKHNDPSFVGFGEIYFSKLLVGQRKAWRRHAHATSQLAMSASVEPMHCSANHTFGGMVKS